MKCYQCGKGVMFGRSHTHHRGVAGGRWKKRAPKTQKLFYPNLQPVMILENGKDVRVRLCTKCIKRIKKDTTDGVKPFLMLKHVPNITPKTVEKIEVEEKDKKLTKKVKKPTKKS